MNIDQIQKINALALDLLRQGLATDREDAVNQAEKIYEHRYGDSSTHIRQTQQAIQAESQPRTTGSSASSSGSVSSAPSSSTSTAVTNDPDLSPEKVKDILEKNTHYLVKTIKEFQERMQSLEKEMAGLRQNMVNARAERMSQPTPQPGEIPATQTIQRGKSEGPTAANHPRTGTYKEGEVSIEKFFNYSGKR